MNWKELMAESLKNISAQVIKAVGNEIVSTAERMEQHQKATKMKEEKTEQHVSDILN